MRQVKVKIQNKNLLVIFRIYHFSVLISVISWTEVTQSCLSLWENLLQTTSSEPGFGSPCCSSKGCPSFFSYCRSLSLVLPLPCHFLHLQPFCTLYMFSSFQAKNTLALEGTSWQTPCFSLLLQHILLVYT